MNKKNPENPVGKSMPTPNKGKTKQTLSPIPDEALYGESGLMYGPKVINTLNDGRIDRRIDVGHIERMKKIEKLLTDYKIKGKGFGAHQFYIIGELLKKELEGKKETKESNTMLLKLQEIFNSSGDITEITIKKGKLSCTVKSPHYLIHSIEKAGAEFIESIGKAGLPKSKKSGLWLLNEYCYQDWLKKTVTLLDELNVKGVKNRCRFIYDLLEIQGFQFPPNSRREKDGMANIIKNWIDRSLPEH